MDAVGAEHAVLHLLYTRFWQKVRLKCSVHHSMVCCACGGRTGQPSCHQPPTPRPLHASSGRHQRSSTAGPRRMRSRHNRLRSGHCRWQLCFLSTQQQLFQCAAAGGGHPWRLCEPTTPVQAPAPYRPPSRPNAHRPNLGPPVAGAAPTGSSQPSSSAQQPNLVVLCRSVRRTHTCSAPDGLADALPLLEFRPLPCSTCCTAHHTL